MLKFDEHVHPQVRSKILWLHMSKKLTYLYNPPCIREVLFLGSLPKRQLDPLGIN